MFYPDYVWIFFNWYTDNWWLSKTNCSRSDLQTKSLARLIRNSLVLDHYPRIEDEDADQPNVGNIVGNYMVAIFVHNNIIYTYLTEQQKFHGIKLLWFTGFDQNVENSFLNQAHAGLRLACAWFLEITLVPPKYVCVCVCPPPRL